jgi:hypothetical protein
MIEVFFDFESEEIKNRPDYPPKPVGLALHVTSGFMKQTKYYAWGHPSGNNCSEEDALHVVWTLMQDPSTWWIAHNTAFDASIIVERWGLPFPWERSSDTMLLAFFHNPYGELSLKPLATKHLHIPPDEQDAVQQWLIRHGVVRSNDRQWGAHISKAPAEIVGPYAIGDVIRTEHLLNFFRIEGVTPTPDSKVKHKRDNTNITFL